MSQLQVVCSKKEVDIPEEVVALLKELLLKLLAKELSKEEPTQPAPFP